MNTRQKIIEATERIIQAKGLARVTTKEIAREVGYAEGTLYKHFEHKEDLFLAVIQESLPDFVAALKERPGTKTVCINLEEIVHAAISYYAKLVPLAVALFADTDLLARHRLWMHAQDAGPQRIHERIATYIEAEQRLGRISQQVDAMSVALLLLGPCFQYVFNLHLMGANPILMTEQRFVTTLVQTLSSQIVIEN
jgi:AcrR family transcriptional regulator